MSYVSPTIEAAGADSGNGQTQPLGTAVLVVASAVAVTFLFVFLAEAINVAAVLNGVAVENVIAAVLEIAIVSTTCFTAGTQITMANGSYKNIENIVAGDVVKTYDERKKRVTKARVLEVFHHAPEETTDYYLIINGNLRVTPNHIMNINYQWKPAGDLKIGDVLQNIKGQKVNVYSVEKVYARQPVFNLEIEKYHTFYAENVLVHNVKTSASSQSQSVSQGQTL